MKVRKYSGELVDFDLQRLKGSLTKSGASNETVELVWEKMNKTIFDGMSTKQLYRLAFQLLKQQRNSLAARYSLKKALRDLGPTGYLFEKWVARLFEHTNHHTLTSLILEGNAVSHEVDVIAQKDNDLSLIECKFRNTVDAKVSVTNPMYFLSRFVDLSDKEFNFFDRPIKFTQAWLVTNAYLTKDAIEFANYYKLNLLSWDYPNGLSIKNRVDSAGLYPLTCLTSINTQEKDKLLSLNYMLVKDILDEPRILEHLNTTTYRRKKIYQEANELVYGFPVNPE
ncbi:restriction endonuclease [Olivibacter sp. LS-1]|uniref:ATP cone domain-containing protein n=1 Tax=Olivibacter sp. LS-1 TaxID=2592345 RepID=UPI0011EAD9CC|nr:ATP cone domain-containing protein [Olivibacter sp. LS-1]QEL02548.1 restriction endonuclease [Olivibacter sp. LS-1]